MGWSTVGDQMSTERAWLSLLGGFEFGQGPERAHLPLGSQRLLALLALKDGGAHRGAAAAQLWPDSSATRAPANLRSALWQGRRAGSLTVIECGGSRLRLAPTIDVDLHTALGRAHQITATARADASAIDHAQIITALSRELLPDWSDEWLLLERERWDQLRMHTLETFAQQLISMHTYLPALEAAMAAVAVEPVRESAHRTVIEVYLAEGNAACALKHYERYRGLIHRELGVTPSPKMHQLIHPLMASEIPVWTTQRR